MFTSYKYPVSRKVFLSTNTAKISSELQRGVNTADWRSFSNTAVYIFGAAVAKRLRSFSFSLRRGNFDLFKLSFTSKIETKREVDDEQRFLNFPSFSLKILSLRHRGIFIPRCLNFERKRGGREKSSFRQVSGIRVEISVDPGWNANKTREEKKVLVESTRSIRGRVRIDRDRGRTISATGGGEITASRRCNFPGNLQPTPRNGRQQRGFARPPPSNWK